MHAASRGCSVVVWQQAEGTKALLTSPDLTLESLLCAASRGYSFVVWLRVEGTKAQGAPGGRALFTLRGTTPEGPKGVAAAFKGEVLGVKGSGLCCSRPCMP